VKLVSFLSLCWSLSVNCVWSQLDIRLFFFLNLHPMSFSGMNVR